MKSKFKLLPNENLIYSWTREPDAEKRRICGQSTKKENVKDHLGEASANHDANLTTDSAYRELGIVK